MKSYDDLRLAKCVLALAASKGYDSFECNDERLNHSLTSVENYVLDNIECYGDVYKVLSRLLDFSSEGDYSYTNLKAMFLLLADEGFVSYGKGKLYISAESDTVGFYLSYGRDYYPYYDKLEMLLEVFVEDFCDLKVA